MSAEAQAGPSKEPGNGKREVHLDRLRAEKLLAKVDRFGKLEALKIADLDTASYQRALNMKFVSELASNWDMAVAGAILVNRRSGKLYVVDGQHRAAGAQRAGETYILAQVIEVSSEEEEALKRVKANRTRPERSIERFKARYVAKDPVAVAIYDMVEKMGGEISWTAGGQNYVHAVGAMERIYNRDGTGDLLSQTLYIVRTAWGGLNAGTCSSPLISGIAYVLENADGVDVNRLVSKLRALGTEALWQRANAFQSALRGSTWINISRAIVEIYNERLTGKNRIDFRRRKSNTPQADEDAAKEADQAAKQQRAEEKEGTNDEPSAEN